MAQATGIPATEATLPPRPPSYPRMIPGQIQPARIAAVINIVITYILQMVIAKRRHYFDLLAFSFPTVGLCLNIHLLTAAFLVRRRLKQIPGYEPREHRLGWILFFDLFAGWGSLIWGALLLGFDVRDHRNLGIAYTIALILVGICHIILMVNDCRFIHYKRRHQKWVNKEITRQSNRSIY